MITYRQPFEGSFPITQKYGEYIQGVTVGKAHTGIDYGCPIGTPIVASADGIVMAAGWDITGFGFRVILQHADGRATLYAHLETIRVDLNQQISQGCLLGFSGHTGKCTGPHLHFEARNKWNDYLSHFDPMKLPLMSVDDTIGQPAHLKGADSFKAGDFLKVTAPNGVKAFFDTEFSYSRMTQYLRNTPFMFTGDTVVRKDNGLTYMRVVPAQFSVWIAVNDGETQLLDKEEA